jgi:hypothetical protein
MTIAKKGGFKSLWLYYLICVIVCHDKILVALDDDWFTLWHVSSSWAHVSCWGEFGHVPNSNLVILLEIWRHNDGWHLGIRHSIFWWSSDSASSYQFLMTIDLDVPIHILDSGASVTNQHLQLDCCIKVLTRTTTVLLPAGDEWVLQLY